MAEPNQWVVFQVEDQRLALDLALAERTELAVAVDPLAGLPETVLGYIVVRGVLTPVFSVRRRLGVADRTLDLADHFLLARTRHRLVALATDGVIGVVEPSAEDIVPSGPAPVDGVEQLADGLLVIRDLDRFLGVAEQPLRRALDEVRA